MTSVSPRAINLPLTEADVISLRAGDEVELTGWVLTGRDQACARIYKMLQAGERLPVELHDQTIYFVGPSPAHPGEVIGSAGPTTSGRMNKFLPSMFAAGLRGVIGKGYLSDEAKRAIVEHRSVYLGAIGGTGALLSSAIEEVKVVAFEELLSEAMRLMRLKNFPVVVLNDAHGGDLYTSATGTKNETP
jgi:fumarate hydratase subunit beta